MLNFYFFLFTGKNITPKFSSQVMKTVVPEQRYTLYLRCLINGLESTRGKYPSRYGEARPAGLSSFCGT